MNVDIGLIAELQQNTVSRPTNLPTAAASAAAKRPPSLPACLPLLGASEQHAFLLITMDSLPDTLCRATSVTVWARSSRPLHPRPLPPPAARSLHLWPAGPHPQCVCAGPCGPRQDHAVRPPHRLQRPHPPQAGGGGQVGRPAPRSRSSTGAAVCCHLGAACQAASCCCVCVPPSDVPVPPVPHCTTAGTWTARTTSRRAASP